MVPVTTMPETSLDMVAIAEELLEQYRITPSPSLLLSAVLTANHVIDWHCKENGEKLDEGMRNYLKDQFTEWNVLREISNGLKHMKPNTNQHHHSDLVDREPGWGDDNFWSGYGTGIPHWYIEINGKQEPVETLCQVFLDKYKLHVNEPSQ
ncbi:hypothetical protein EHLJMEHL_02187 [Vreelandella titanicae]